MQIQVIVAPDAASLIADSGHPNFPGWEVIAALLLVATLALAITSQQQDPARRHSNRASMPIVRIAKAGRLGVKLAAANAVRLQVAA